MNDGPSTTRGPPILTCWPGRTDLPARLKKSSVESANPTVAGRIPGRAVINAPRRTGFGGSGFSPAGRQQFDNIVDGKLLFALGDHTFGKNQRCFVGPIADYMDVRLCPFALRFLCRVLWRFGHGLVPFFNDSVNPASNRPLRPGNSRVIFHIAQHDRQSNRNLDPQPFSRRFEVVRSMTCCGKRLLAGAIACVFWTICGTVTAMPESMYPLGVLPGRRLPVGRVDLKVSASGHSN